MYNTMKSFYLNVIKRVSYWLPLLFWAVLSYGFSTFNPTVSTDDLAREYYVGDGNAMISATRWGMVVWVKLLSTVKYIPGLDHLLGVALLILGAVTLSIVLYSLSEEKKYSIKYLVFSALIITYPLINEIWEYNGANMIVAGNILLVGLVHLYLLCEEHSKLKKYIITGCSLSIVASSYESGVFVYITVVFIILFYKYVIQNVEQKRLDWLKEGVPYIIPLAIAVILRIVIGIFLIKMMGLSYSMNGATAIKWGENNINGFILFNAYAYILEGLVYFPITIFLLFTLAFIGYCIWSSMKQKRILPCIMGILLLLSLFGQAVLQFDAMPYRTAQTLTVFVGFCGYFLFEHCEKTIKNKSVFFKIIVGLFLFLCHHQATYLNSLLTLDHLRSENEIAMVRKMGYDLKSEYDDKEVVFVGEYSLGDYINEEVIVGKSSWNEKLFYMILPNEYKEKIHKYVHTNVNSLLSWSKKAFENQSMMQEYFKYCGFDVQTVETFTEEFYQKNIEIAKKSGMKPFEIKDMGDYLIVCIGTL